MVNKWKLFGQLIGGGCPLCGAPGDTICAACLEGLPLNRYACPRCAMPLPQGLVPSPQRSTTVRPDMLAAENGEISAPGPAILCGDCLSQAPAFDRALAPLLYQFPVDGLVAGFKYHHRLHWGRILGDLLADHLVHDAAPPGLLLPVPATAARLRERGFNQAAELARRLSLRLGIPWRTGLLLRIRDAVQQQGLSGPQRRRNMRGAFACRGRLPARVALIDDVITTGATAGAASAALKDAGVEWVEVWAVARTPKGH